MFPLMRFLASTKYLILCFTVHHCFICCNMLRRFICINICCYSQNLLDRLRVSYWIKFMHIVLCVWLKDFCVKNISFIQSSCGSSEIVAGLVWLLCHLPEVGVCRGSHMTFSAPAAMFILSFSLVKIVHFNFGNL